MRVCETCHTPYKSNIDFCGLDGSKLFDRDGDGLVGVVIDRYRLVARIGGGGMAAVYRAQHETIDREVAIKLLYGELASNKEFAERFRREAQASSKIKHKNVVEVVDFGTTKDGASFLIMELLRGRTLGATLSQAGTFTPARAARIVRDIAQGLAAAHDLGFVHRDLKPGNVMIVGEGDAEIAKLVDFGLVADDAGVSTTEKEKLTQSGVAMGTPHYMAPEQIAGLGCTAQTDLYSLGVVLHELLTGATPFHGSVGEVLAQHAQATPPRLPPAQGLEKLADKLLEKQPRRRPKDAWHVLTLLADTGLIEQPQQKQKQTPSSSSSSSSTDDLLDALGPALATETSMKVPPIPPSSTQQAIPLPSSSPWKGVVLAGVLAAGVAVAVVVAKSDAGADTVAVKAAQDKLAAAALDAARSVVVGDAGMPEVTDPRALTKADEDVKTALASRGLDRDDVKAVPSVRDALARYDAAAAEDKAEAAAVVVTAVAGVRVDAAMVRRKIERLEKQATSKRTKKQLEQAKQELKKKLSEAERGKLMQRLAALDR